METESIRNTKKTLLLWASHSATLQCPNNSTSNKTTSLKILISLRTKQTQNNQPKIKFKDIR